jgi:hypothetical protein
MPDGVDPVRTAQEIAILFCGLEVKFSSGFVFFRIESDLFHAAVASTILYKACKQRISHVAMDFLRCAIVDSVLKSLYPRSDKVFISRPGVKYCFDL